MLHCVVVGYESFRGLCHLHFQGEVHGAGKWTWRSSLHCSLPRGIYFSFFLSPSGDPFTGFTHPTLAPVSHPLLLPPSASTYIPKYCTRHPEDGGLKSSEKLVSYCSATYHHKPEYHDLNNHHFESLKSCIIMYCCLYYIDTPDDDKTLSIKRDVGVMDISDWNMVILILINLTEEVKQTDGYYLFTLYLICLAYIPSLKERNLMRPSCCLCTLCFSS
jgi:hypothetical protein